MIIESASAQARRAVKLAVVALASLLVSGCLSPSLSSLDGVRADQAVVMGRFSVLYNGEDVTNGCNLVFNAPAFGVSKNQFRLTQDGYVFAAFPVGTSQLDFVLLKSGRIQHHFKSGEVSCQFVGHGVVNYFGDVTIDWRGMGKGSALLVQTVGGAVGSALLTQGQIAVTVEANTAAAEDALRKRFAGKRAVTPALLAVRSGVEAAP